MLNETIFPSISIWVVLECTRMLLIKTDQKQMYRFQFFFPVLSKIYQWICCGFKFYKIITTSNKLLFRLKGYFLCFYLFVLVYLIHFWAEFKNFIFINCASSMILKIQIFNDFCNIVNILLHAWIKIIFGLGPLC